MCPIRRYATNVIAGLAEAGDGSASKGVQQLWKDGAGSDINPGGKYCEGKRSMMQTAATTGAERARCNKRMKLVSSRSAEMVEKGKAKVVVPAAILALAANQHDAAAARVLRRERGDIEEEVAAHADEDDEDDEGPPEPAPMLQGPPDHDAPAEML